MSTNIAQAVRFIMQMSLLFALSGDVAPSIRSKRGSSFFLDAIASLDWVYESQSESLAYCSVRNHV